MFLIRLGRRVYAGCGKPKRFKGGSPERVIVPTRLRHLPGLTFGPSQTSGRNNHPQKLFSQPFTIINTAAAGVSERDQRKLSLFSDSSAGASMLFRFFWKVTSGCGKPYKGTEMWAFDPHPLHPQPLTENLFYRHVPTKTLPRSLQEDDHCL